MNITNTTAKVIAVIVAVVVITWAVASMVSSHPSSQPAQSTTPSSGGVVKLGFIGPLTGDAANLGQNAKTAVQLAVDEVNQSGGIQGKQLQMVYEDGQCNGTAASNAANKLMNVDQVPVILGGACSGETGAFAPAAKQAGVVVFSYCSSNPALSKAGIFRDYPSDAYQGSFGADYVYNTLGKRKAAVMFAKTDYGVGIKQVFENEFQKLGGTIVDEEGFDQGTRDLRTQLAKVKAAKPDIVYFVSMTDEAVVGIKQAGELGLKMPFFGGDGWDDPKIPKTTGSASNGDMYTVPKPTRLDDFKAQMKAKTGSDEVLTCSPYAYDAVKLMAQVIGKVGTDPAAIRTEMFKTLYTGGVSSDKISFDENGDLVGAAYSVKVIQNGTATVKQ